MDELKNNFSKKVQMHLACATDDTRPIMNCVFFKDGFAYASDGFILVKNRISEISGLSEEEIAALDGKLIHREFYKDMIKYDTILISEEGIECHKGTDKVFFYFSIFGDGKYPDAEQSLRDALNSMTVSLPQIGFKLKDIMRLQKALHGSDFCKATFKGVNKPIVFDSIVDGVSSVGLLMPCIIYESEVANG